MSTPDWTIDEAWDVLVLGEVRVPGVARVKVTLPSGLDKKKPKGGGKARIRDLGAQPAELSIEVQLLPEEMAEFEARIVPKLRARSVGGVAQKLSITHPNAALWGVNQVKIGKVGSPMPSSGGGYVIEFEAIEHVDHPKRVKKPDEVAEGDWTGQAQSGIDALSSGPSQSGAAEQNFSSLPDDEGSGGIPGSGF